MDELDVKWKIIMELSKKKHTKEELAEKLKISQIIVTKHLQALGKQDAINRTKNSPAYYSMKREFALLVIISKGFTNKKIIELDDFKKKYIKELINRKNKVNKPF
ncbi:MAG: ArsR family transcriptional regulator [archaeon]